MKQLTNGRNLNPMYIGRCKCCDAIFESEPDECKAQGIVTEVNTYIMDCPRCNKPYGISFGRENTTSGRQYRMMADHNPFLPPDSE